MRNGWQELVNDGFHFEITVTGEDNNFYLYRDGTLFSKGPNMFALLAEAGDYWRAKQRMRGTSGNTD